MYARRQKTMSNSEEETIAALTLLFEKVAELGYMNIRDMLIPGKYDQYKAALDEAYDALVNVEEALDGLGLKLEYQHWRISSAFEEIKPLLIQPRSRADMALEAFAQDRERPSQKFQQS
jgi:hypothetical protein